MPSDEFRTQAKRIERLVAEQCPGHMVIFDDHDPDKIRFGLQHCTTGKRSGRSAASTPIAVRDRDDERWKKVLHLMVEQSER